MRTERRSMQQRNIGRRIYVETLETSVTKEKEKRTKKKYKHLKAYKPYAA